MNMKGRIHSIETMGLVDGPGVRTIVFFQGCRLRCKYCHNPDTWNFRDGELIEGDALMNKIKRYKPYWKKSGGITFSGGEPLMQPEFLTYLLQECKKEGIHTALDTAGFGLGSYETILKYTDLVILDIKHVSQKGYMELVGGSMRELARFKAELEKTNTPLWLRHVIIPGLTDSPIHLKRLKELILRFKNVEKVELLPYHTMGLEKYEKMGIKYPLTGIDNMDQKKVKMHETTLRTEILLEES